MKILNSEFEGYGKGNILLNNTIFPLEIKNTNFENCRIMKVNPICNFVSFMNCTFVSQDFIELMRYSNGNFEKEGVVIKNSTFNNHEQINIFIGNTMKSMSEKYFTFIGNSVYSNSVSILFQKRFN